MSLKSLSPRDRDVFKLVARAAERGLPCPTSREIMVLMEAKTLSIAPKCLARLQRRGLIKLESFATARIVTIVRTGKSTRAPNSKAPHWRHVKAMAVDSSSGYVMVGDAPSPPIGTLKRDYGALADEMTREAFRRGDAVPDFLSYLVGVGWRQYIAGKAQPGTSSGLV